MNRSTLGTLALLAAIGAPSEAASIIPHTAETRVRLSAGVFGGYLDAVDVEEVDGVPVTTLRFTEVRWAYGGEGTLHAIRYLGGTLGERTVHASGMPVFEPGFRYVVMVDSVGDRYVPFTAGEYGAFQVVTSAHGDELLVNAPGEVLLLSGTGKVRSVTWFDPSAYGVDIAASAPDFRHAVSEVELLDIASRWAASGETISLSWSGSHAVLYQKLRGDRAWDDALGRCAGVGGQDTVFLPGPV